MASWQKQDEFAKLVNGQNIGVFLDIGSNDPVLGNNTIMLEESGWSGVAIDKMEFDYSKRNLCDYQCADAKTHDYSKIDHVDYLSLDCDSDSADVLERFLVSCHSITCATIEHDRYCLDDWMATRQRSMMHGIGMILLFKDICVEVDGFHRPFEDWWISPWSHVAKNTHKLHRNNILWSEAIKLLYDT